MLLLASAPVMASGPPMVWFESGSARLTPLGERILDWAIVWLRSVGAQEIHVDGYADRVGPGLANLRLSRRRAETVRDGLVRRGFPEDRVRIRAFGETEPLIETADGVSEPQNRYAIVVIERMTPPTR